MKRLLTVVVVSGLAVTACSDDPTSSEEYQELELQLVAAEQRIDDIAAERDAAEQQLDDIAAEPVDSESSEAAPLPSVPADAEFVVGTASCSLTEDGIDVDDPEQGAGGLLVVCELDMSDPRVSGAERHDRFRTLAESRNGLIWLVEDATITNDEGTWRGTALGADSGGPVQGEAHYVGEGDYAGLEFHYYFSHMFGDEDVPLRGWIFEDA